jgi:hypothetical protein
MIARASTALALAALLGAPARTNAAPASHPASAYPDGGTIRASGIYVPQAVKDRREKSAPPPQQKKLINFAAPDVLAVLGPFRPEVGAWAEYVVLQNKRQVSRVLISVLPPPMPDGSYWLEIDSAGEELAPTALRLLAHGNPGEPGAIDRAIVYVAAQTAFELPMQALEKEHARPRSEPSGADLKTAHHVAVRVKAGSYDTDRIQLSKGKEKKLVWRSDAVPLFGLVKSESGGRVTELSACGHSGAHTLITTPILNEGIPAAMLNGRAPGGSPGDAKADEPGDAQGNGSDSK